MARPSRLAKYSPHRGASALWRLAVAQQLDRLVQPHRDRLQLEGDLIRIEIVGNLALVACARCLVAQVADPALPGLLDLFVQLAVAGVPLRRHRAHEAAAGERRVREVLDPRVASRDKAGEATGLLVPRLPDLLGEDRPGAVERGALQLGLVAEVPDDPRLAQAEVIGQSTDRDALETLDRRGLDRTVDDGRARARCLFVRPSRHASNLDALDDRAGTGSPGGAHRHEAELLVRALE